MATASASVPRHIYTAYNEVGGGACSVDVEGVRGLNLGVKVGTVADAELYTLLFTQSHSQQQPEWDVESVEAFECSWRHSTFKSACWHFLHFAVDCNSSAASFVAILVFSAVAVIVVLLATKSSNISSMRLAVELDVELAVDAVASTNDSGAGGVAGIVAAAFISASACIPPFGIVTLPPCIASAPLSATLVTTAAAARLLFSFLRLLAACPFI